MKASPSNLSGMRSWQDISQRAAGQPLSPVAWRKRFARFLSTGATLLLGASLLALGVWALVHLAGNGSGVRSPLRQVEFKSDGVLTDLWAREYLQLQMGEPLQQYDIFALRNRLLASKQIRDASVERVLPDILRIHVTERRPWARVAADNGAGGFNTFLVARDGMVFEPAGYTDYALNRLPWLAGVTLHRESSGGFAPIQGMNAVAELLTLAQGSVPQLAEEWTVVDLGQYDERPQAVSSLLKVHSRNFGDIIFTAGNFRTQIDRLAMTAHTLQERHVQPARMDLSLDNQVVVKPASLPPLAANPRRTAAR